MKQYSPVTSIAYLLGPILILISHLGSLLVIISGLSWGGIIWLIMLYELRMIATTAIYHRLLTHKSYQAPACILYLGCIVAASAGQMGPSWWKAHHLDHHQWSDKVNDPHSPCIPFDGVQGFWWSQVGWLLPPQFFPSKLPSDVENDVILKYIDRLHFIPMITLATISYLIGGVEYLGAFFLSTTLLFHGVATVNSVSHLIGSQPFKTQDHSRNNWFVAILTLGEGWHNLHHAFQYSARHGITLDKGQVVYLIDPTFWFIKLLSMLKLATKIRIPSEAELLARSNCSDLDLLSENRRINSAT
jgi:stearoyl-CoA desaturase (delta-9 desaturase)